MLDFLTRKPQLRAGRFGQLSVAKQIGEAIDFTWPCINNGDGDGAAFLQILEPANSSLGWVGSGFTIPAKTTVTLTLRQNNLNLPLGLHNLVAEMREGIFSTRIIASESVELNMVSFPVLTSVGLPVIANIPGELLPAGPIRVKAGSAIPIAWPCENSGAGAGQARLRALAAPLTTGDLTITGPLIEIPGASTTTLTLALGTSRLLDNFIYQVRLTMEDQNGNVLGTFSFSVSAF